MKKGEKFRKEIESLMDKLESLNDAELISSAEDEKETDVYRIFAAGIVLAEREQFEESKKIYEKALKLSDKMENDIQKQVLQWNLFSEMSFSYINSDLRAADELAEKAIAIHPEHIMPYIAKMSVFMDSRDIMDFKEYGALEKRIKKHVIMTDEEQEEYSFMDGLVKGKFMSLLIPTINMPYNFDNRT